ncbi:hypothetical protein V1508DRAFT_395759 [Lipomyces doorenjongii]|uniref:uncharacterized protein n=1 Tax=Lipomyces doorenjongii TaxID=383834 RepID=UPI0034CDCA77
MTANSPLFYTEDTVYTDNTNNIGIVEKTWHDTVRDYTNDKYDEEALEGPPEISDHYFKWGLPPRGWTIVAETLGRRVIPDSALRLVDRSFSVGDVCKRSSQDAQSGTVIDVSMTVSLQHTLTNNVIHDVPGDEIQLYLFPEQGQFVSDSPYRVGEIVATSYKAAVRLRNGGMVWVDDALELNVVVPETASRVAPAGGIAPALIAETTEVVFPHQTVSTDRENIRRGQWIYGAFDFHIPPIGTVLRSEVQGISVRWLPEGTEDYFESEDEDFANLKAFSDKMDGANWTVGDRVVFKDRPGAYAKYDMTRLGRERYGGFDVNALIVTATHTKLKILWQDLTTSVEDAIDLVPYLLVDDHDIWPGEYVGRKDITKMTVDAYDIDLDYTQIGVAQHVNAKERTAKVRWFNDTDKLTPENISDQIEDVSFYELVPHPLISYGIGDFVYLPHTPYFSNDGNSQMAAHEQDSGGIMSSLARAILRQGNHQLTQLARSFLPLRSGHSTPVYAHSGDNSTTASSENLPLTCDWYGQIVSLNLDGSVTVRLGFSESVKEVDLPASLLIGAPEDDDDEGDDDYEYEEDQDLDDSDSSMDDEYDDNDDIVEVDSTQSLRRLMVPDGRTLRRNNDDDDDDDDDDDSSWVDEDEFEGTEADDEGDVDEKQDVEKRKQKVGEDTGMTSLAQTPANVPVPVPPPIARQESAVSDQTISLDPAQFLILDIDPDGSHHFASRSPSKLNHRRIARERKILSSSLPEGIYVRSYTNRLDLFRALIVGPRGTPYEMAPFMFDIHVTSNFPADPPDCFFHSWNTNGVGRVNPNLYEDGKICLSLLGTWPGEQTSEKWNPETSSILQLLVSLQSLVLNNMPYYNEAGYDAVQGTGTAAVNAELYSERTFVLARGFVLFAVQNYIPEFDSVVKYLYFEKGYLKCVVEWEREVIANSEGDSSSPTVDTSSGRIVKVTKGAKILLVKNYTTLRRILEEETK